MCILPSISNPQRFIDHNLMFTPSFERKDSPGRGRHLVATRNIRKGEVIFFERPLISLQSLGNGHQGALVCRCCRCFIGGPDLALFVASKNIKREDVWEFYNENEKDLTRGYDNYKMVPCRHSCGELYCSKECESNMWNCCGHDLLCTGLIPEPNVEDPNDSLHPLLQFKVHACQNNEIFIMVADLVAAAVSQMRQRLAQSIELNSSSEEVLSFLQKFMSPYLDFTLEPWWKVVTEPMLSDPMKMVECVSLNKTLRDLCRKSSNLLKKGILSRSTKDDLYNHSLCRAVTECDNQYGMFSEDFFGNIVGSFEQNAIGILARNPLCRDILENSDLRIRRHDEIIKCIEIAGLIGNDCCEDDDKEANESIDENDDDDNENDIDYSPDEIAAYIANLEIDEEGRINTREGKVDGSDDYNEDLPDGDDLDTLFSPLDGTAMYYTACKMNHSCVPNVIAKYAYSCSPGGPRARWGSLYPLMIKCCALRDIEVGDELCISYIKSDGQYHERQAQLETYGFTCDCIKCKSQRHGLEYESDLSDLYDDNVRIDCDEDRLLNTDGTENNRIEGKLSSGEHMLLQRVRLLDQQRAGLSCIPLDQLNASFEILSKLSSELVTRLQGREGSGLEKIVDLLKLVRNHLKQNNTNDVLFYALEGEYNTRMLGNGSCPEESIKEAHAIFSMISAVSQAQRGNAYAALKINETAITSGLPVTDIESLHEMVRTKVQGLELHCINCTQI